MRCLILTLALAGLALPATAQEVVETRPSASQQLAGRTMSCDYTMECYEQEACTFTQFGHDVEMPEDFPGEASLEFGTGPAKGNTFVIGDGVIVQASDANAAYQLTSTEDGFARLSVHFMKDLSVITYHGECTLAR